MTQRKRIKETANLDLYSLEGTLQHAIECLQALAKEYGNDAGFALDTRWCYDDYTYEYVITFFRDETDSEMNKRLRAAVKRRERNKKKKAEEAKAKEAKERKELERLLKKYGDEHV